MKIQISKYTDIIKDFFSSNNLLSNQFISENFKSVIIISGSLVLIAIFIKVFIYWKIKKHTVKQKIANIIFTWLITISLISFFLLFCLWQGIGFLSYMFWWYLLGLTFIIWGIIICIYWLKKYPREFEEYENIKRKEKYLPQPKSAASKRRR